MIALIEEACHTANIPYVKLTGKTIDRDAVIQEFQSGKVPLFLISLKAGGVGLNLTQADTVIHYDPWWNPAVENQATDRAHRIGQDKTVFVYKLITSGTIEEKILALQAEKQALLTSMLSGSIQSVDELSMSNIEKLFAPLSVD
jgi:SNF2 family DNA or RNA helicase